MFCARISAVLYQDCRVPSRVRPGTATVAGLPVTASCTCARICDSRPAQKSSYFDPTPPVCPDREGNSL
jgi:hypothetical protein